MDCILEKTTKFYNKLKMDNNYFHCTKHHKMLYGKYIIDNSERSTGKTTSYLIYCICNKWVNGKSFCYLRQNGEQIAPKMSSTLFDTVLALGLISKITGDFYNTVVYKNRKWFLAYVDDDGNVERKDTEALCYMLSVKNHNDYKSVLNVPNVDIILFDEFINDIYYPNEFIMFCDLCKTIIRGRQNILIIMLANTINIHSPYYKELEIYKDVSKMCAGQHKIITTEKGTIIDFLFISNNVTSENKATAKLFFGFNNPELSAITGGATQWNFANCQHIPEDIEYHTLLNNVYLYDYGELLRLEVVDIETYRDIGVFVHRATRTYDDSIIYSVNYREDIDLKMGAFYYGLGDDKFSRFIWDLFINRKFYFADNSLGSLVRNYVDSY